MQLCKKKQISCEKMRSFIVFFVYFCNSESQMSNFTEYEKQREKLKIFYEANPM